jgi:hypothetical protein
MGTGKEVILQTDTSENLNSVEMRVFPNVLELEIVFTSMARIGNETMS